MVVAYLMPGGTCASSGPLTDEGETHSSGTNIAFGRRPSYNQGELGEDGVLNRLWLGGRYFIRMDLGGADVEMGRRHHRVHNLCVMEEKNILWCIY